MTVSRGKQFENVIREAFERVPDVSVDRLHDQTNGFVGSQNICDFIVYKKPHEYYIECKTVHGNTLSIHSNDPKKRYGNITNRQWEGLLEKSHIKGVFAGIICWWVDKDVTMFLPIAILNELYHLGYKSVRYDSYMAGRKDYGKYVTIQGKKKRVFFDYDMSIFFKEMENG